MIPQIQEETSCDMTIELHLLLLAALFISSKGEVFHVTPTLPSTQPCPSPCYTIDQYAQNDPLFDSHTNITLIFLTGDHILSQNFSLTRVNELSLLGQKSYMYNRKKVSIDLHRFQIHLEVSTDLLIRGITLNSGFILIERSVEVNISRGDFSLFFLTLDQVALNIQKASRMHINECKCTLSSLQFIDTDNGAAGSIVCR